jgi:hypothetical protein
MMRTTAMTCLQETQRRMNGPILAAIEVLERIEQQYPPTITAIPEAMAVVPRTSIISTVTLSWYFADVLRVKLNLYTVFDDWPLVAHVVAFDGDGRDFQTTEYRYLPTSNQPEAERATMAWGEFITSVTNKLLGSLWDAAKGAS